MLKAKATGKDGRPLYLLGLERRNVERLLQGDPIYFQGDILGLAGHHFLILGTDNPGLIKLEHARFAADSAKLLHSISLAPRTLGSLEKVPVRLDHQQLERMKLQGSMMIFAAANTAALKEVLRGLIPESENVNEDELRAAARDSDQTPDPNPSRP